MPQIGWSELLVVIIIAILVIGPKDLPIVLKKIGSTVKKIKSYVTNIQDEIENAVEADDIINEKKNKKKKS